MMQRKVRMPIDIWVAAFNLEADSAALSARHTQTYSLIFINTIEGLSLINQILCAPRTITDIT